MVLHNMVVNRAMRRDFGMGNSLYWGMRFIVYWNEELFEKCDMKYGNFSYNTFNLEFFLEYFAKITLGKVDFLNIENSASSSEDQLIH